MTQALYRRYRPETFAEVIGQDHVTAPLMAALESGRISHAYLFSGPRGCGKTSSARILARCLNCEKGPTSQPCGECPSCRDLGRSGAGSLDVVEIDAASHNGVDDARDLRERAVFAPSRDRFKIFILDEAHMVTSQGFNALLKIVEEPPPHVKFIFATTEPEKVIGTIRSRTHHYPFRLVPPGIMRDYMAQLCDAEEISAEPAALDYVVRAGGGSVRDTESVLDQLMAGAENNTITRTMALGLLGYTPQELLERMTQALTDSDGGQAFRVVDSVIESGQDPRRFVEDLLTRLRDLLVLSASSREPSLMLPGVPEDALQLMTAQAASLGMPALSCAADAVNEGLTQMTGATSPKLLLELLTARMFVRVGHGLTGKSGEASERPVPQPAQQSVPQQPDRPVAQRSPQPAGRPARDPLPTPPQAPDSTHDRPAPLPGAAPKESKQPATDLPSGQPPASTPASGPAAGPTVEAVLQRWEQVIERLGQLRRFSRALVEQNATVTESEAGVVTLSFPNDALAHTFTSGGHAAPLEQALSDTFGLPLRVATSGGESPTVTSSVKAPALESADPHHDIEFPEDPRSRADGAWGTPGVAPLSGERESGVKEGEGAQADDPAIVPKAAPASAPNVAREDASAADSATSRPRPGPESVSGAVPLAEDPAAKSVASSKPISAFASATGGTGPANPEDNIPSADDLDADKAGLIGTPLVQKVLGGQVIEEIVED